MKLLIGIPTVDYIHYMFVDCLTRLCRRLALDGIGYDLYFHGGTLVHIAREEIVTKAIDGGYTHILWLDADMIFKETVFNDLLANKKPFVTGICHARRPPYRSALFRSLEPVERYSGDNYPGITFEVGGCGFACVLIETAVMRDVREKAGTCFLPMMQFGEDLSFCYRAKAFGHHIHADPSIRLGHISHKVIYPEDAEK